MILAILVALTIISGIAIIGYKKKNKKSFKLNKLGFRQTLMHEAIKDFLPAEIYKARPSVITQAKKHKNKTTFRFVKTPDQKVYWVKDNIFYWTEIVDETFDPTEGKPIDTNNLSKKEIEKLLYILDTLKDEQL